MKIHYKSKKLRKICEDPKMAQKEYGLEIGNKLIQRMMELISAESLKDIKNIPAARLHKLKGTRKGEYAVDLVHPHRLIICPLLEDGRNIDDLEKITIVRVEEVGDYHGKHKRK